MKLSVKTFARTGLATGLLSLTLLAACGDNTATTVPTTTTAAITTAASATTTKAATTSGAAATTATGAATTGAGTAAAAAPASAKGIQALTELGQNLTATADALAKNDLSAAKVAYKKFDDGWTDSEGYVQQFSRKLYQDIEEAMTPVGRELLRNSTTTVATVTPLLKTLTATYTEGLKQMSAAVTSGAAGATATAISGAEVDAATAKVDDYLKGEADKLVTELNLLSSPTQNYLVKTVDLADSAGLAGLTASSLVDLK